MLVYYCSCDHIIPQNFSQSIEFESMRLGSSLDENESRKAKAFSRTNNNDNDNDNENDNLIKFKLLESRNSSESLKSQDDSQTLFKQINKNESHVPKTRNRMSYDLNRETRQDMSEEWKLNPNRGNELESQLDTAESRKSELNLECALILKRTYILKNQNNDEWGDKFVFNENDPDDKKPEIHKSDLCIKHSDVDRAIEEAKHTIKFSKPNDIDNFEPSEKSIASVAELSLATGHILAKKFDLSHDEILNALPMIDMTSSKFYWKELCPKNVRPMICTKSRYRTITAHCNNLKHPSWGASNTPYSRYLPPDYADGLDLPRASVDGKPLPSARLISSMVHRDDDNPSNDYSILFASWGQLLDHDMTRAALGSGKYSHLYFINIRYENTKLTN